MSSPPESKPAVAAVVVRALLYALAIAALVIFAPEDVQFVYMGF